MAQADLADLAGRDERGNWKPVERIEMPGHLRWPLQPAALLKWLFGFPGYLWPFHAIWFGFACLSWFLLTPPLETMARFAPGWMAVIFLRNLALLLVWFGFWHVRLHLQRAQGLRYKYNDRWMSTDNRKFLFRSQTRDNMFWSVVSGCGLWSAYEVATLWAYANGLLPWLALRSNPVFFVLLFLAIPVIRDLHFYAVHRLLHWKPLYRAAHYVHHKNVNVGPWSGLAMHPIEHLLYFSGVLLHWVLPSHPLHALFHLQHAAFSPAAGHSGFEATEFGHESAALTHGSYFHYLHHRYFECNYAGDNAMVLDRFFGSLHNGTPAAHATMRARAHARMRTRKATAC